MAFENPRSIAAAEELLQRQLAKQRKSAAEILSMEALMERSGDIYDVPDRLTGRESVEMLRRLHPDREWRFVEVNIDYQVSGNVVKRGPGRQQSD